MNELYLLCALGQVIWLLQYLQFQKRHEISVTTLVKIKELHMQNCYEEKRSAHNWHSAGIA